MCPLKICLISTKCTAVVWYPWADLVHIWRHWFQFTCNWVWSSALLEKADKTTGLNSKHCWFPHAISKDCSDQVFQCFLLIISVVCHWSKQHVGQEELITFFIFHWSYSWFLLLAELNCNEELAISNVMEILSCVTICRVGS